MVFMYRMRPVPVVFRPLAFSPQLYFLVFFEGYPQEEQVFFWMWKETFPHRRQVVWDLLCRFPNEVVPLVCSGNKSHDLATKETCEIRISDGKWLQLQRTVPRNCPISELRQRVYNDQFNLVADILAGKVHLEMCIVYETHHSAVIPTIPEKTTSPAF